MMTMFHRDACVPTHWLFPALAILAASLAVACGSAAATTPATVPAVIPAAASSGGLEPILATTILHVGAQRVSFLLTTPDSLVKVPEATVTSVFLGDGQAVTETKRA